MAKKPEAYRGEDRTLELIRTKYNEMLGDDGVHFDNHAWDIAVESVYCDFIAEGLVNSAEAVMKHQTPDYLKHVHEPWVKTIEIIPENVEKWKFASGGTLSLNPDDRRSLIGQSGPEAIMPPRNSNH